MQTKNMTNSRPLGANPHLTAHSLAGAATREASLDTILAADMAIAPLQSRDEEYVNAALHALGLLLALVGGSWLVLHTLQGDDATKTGSAAAFVLTLILLYTASTLYHAFPPGPTKERWQRLDRGAIALLIAGTYTPIGLLMVGGTTGSLLCALEWAAAFMVVVLIARGPRFAQRSAWVYQAMGWLTALGGPAFLRNTPHSILLALGLGGLCYMAGILFLIRDRTKYFHAAFHVLVLAGSICQFWAIARFLR